jgi:hypothetical protein
VIKPSGRGPPGSRPKRGSWDRFRTDRVAVGWSQRARADLGAIFAHLVADNRGAQGGIRRILQHTDVHPDRAMDVPPALETTAQGG